MTSEESNDIVMFIPRDAAKVLGVAERLLKERIKNGEIRTMVWGNEKRIPSWELKRWQEEQLALQASPHQFDAEIERIMSRVKSPRYRPSRPARSSNV